MCEPIVADFENQGDTHYAPYIRLRQMQAAGRMMTSDRDMPSLLHKPALTNVDGAKIDRQIEKARKGVPLN